MAKNILICGSGRSGTSMLAGVFSDTIYYQGEDLYPPREANPKGFFENWTINSLNESIIHTSLKSQYGGELSKYFKLLYKPGQLWLANIPIDFKLQISDKFITEIKKVTSCAPFCFKDPRFCFTLEAWVNNVENVHVLCIFREPGSVVASILKELHHASYLNDLSISVKDLYKNWRLMYSRVLDLKLKGYPIFFIKFEDLLHLQKIEELEEFAGAKLNSSFPDSNLNRTHGNVELDKETLSIYKTLESFSGYKFAGQTAENLERIIKNSVSVLKVIKQAANEVYANNDLNGRLDYSRVLTEGDMYGLVKILYSDYHSVRSELHDNKKEIKQLSRSNHAATVELDDAKKNIDLYKLHINELESQLADLTLKEEQNEKIIQVLKAEIETLKKKNTDLESENTSFGKNIRNLQMEKRNNLELIHTLSNKITDYTSEIEAMRNSHSWRITKPLRYIRALLKNNG